MKPARHPHHRWATLLLAGVLGAASVHAQGTRQPARSPEVQQRIAQAKQRLQLTPEQETKLRAILQDEAQKLRAIRDKYANDTTLQGRGARSRELQGVQDDLHRKVQGVLSPAQMDEWDRMAAERGAQARERRQQQP